MIEGRDIGTVVAPQAEVKVYLVADPSDPRRPAPGRAAGHRRRRARHRPEASRRIRPCSDAARRRRRDDRHLGARDRGRDRADRGRSSARTQQFERLRRPRLEHLAALALAADVPLLPASHVRPRPHPGRGRLRARDQPSLLGRHPRSSARSRRGTSTTSRRSRCATCPDSARFSPGTASSPCAAASPTGTRCARCVSSPRDGRALGVFVEGTRQKRLGVPGTRSRARRWSRSRTDVPVVPIARLRHAVLAARQLRALHSTAVGEPFMLEGLPKGGKGYKEASLEIERAPRALFDWLAGIHARGRPANEVPPL